MATKTLSIKKNTRISKLMRGFYSPNNNKSSVGCQECESETI